MSIATFAGILAQTQAADSRCISLRALQPQRNNAPVGATHEGVFDLP
jgi:hypothetical protein